MIKINKADPNEWQCGEEEYLLQMKIILTVFRNIFMIKTNESEIKSNEKLKKKLFWILLHNQEVEINKLVFDVFTVLSKYL